MKNWYKIIIKLHRLYRKHFECHITLAAQRSVDLLVNQNSKVSHGDGKYSTSSSHFAQVLK